MISTSEIGTLAKNVQIQLLSVMGCNKFFGPIDWLQRTFQGYLPISNEDIGKILHAHYGISVIDEMALPVSLGYLHNILSSPCPLVEGKTVGDTHFLYYLPSQIYPGQGPKQLCSMTWRSRILHMRDYLREENEHKDCFNCDQVEYETSRYSWLLMFEGIIPGSTDSSWKDHQQMIPDGYELPTLIECLSMPFLVDWNNGRQVVADGMWGRVSNSRGANSHISVGDFTRHSYSCEPIVNFERRSNLGLFLHRKLEECSI